MVDSVEVVCRLCSVLVLIVGPFQPDFTLKTSMDRDEEKPVVHDLLLHSFRILLSSRKGYARRPIEEFLSIGRTFAAT